MTKPTTPGGDAIADCVMQVMRDAPKDRPWGFVAAAVSENRAADGIEIARRCIGLQAQHAIALATDLLHEAAELIAEDPSTATLYGKLTAALVALEYAGEVQVLA